MPVFPREFHREVTTEVVAGNTKCETGALIHDESTSGLVNYRMRRLTLNFYCGLIN